MEGRGSSRISEGTNSSSWIPISSEAIGITASTKRALLLLGQHLRWPGTVDVGARRLGAALEAVVSDDGVSVEQSVHYHHYIFTQLGIGADVLESVDGTAEAVGELRRRGALMPELLAHATRSDGS